MTTEMEDTPNDSGTNSPDPSGQRFGMVDDATNPAPGGAATARPCHTAPRPTVAAAVVLADVAFMVGLAASVGYALWALGQ